MTVLGTGERLQEAVCQNDQAYREIAVVTINYLHISLVPICSARSPATSLDGDNGDDTVARFNNCFSNIRRDHFWRKLLISLLTRKLATLVSQLWLMRRASDCHFNLGANQCTFLM